MNAIVKTNGSSTAIRPVLVPQTFDQLLRFAELAASTDMVPKDFRGKPGNIMLAVQMGSELGLSPMQSLNSIAVINGRPGIWGDGLIGLCRQSSLCQDIVETFEGEGETRTAVCVATRRGASPCTGRFSVADAKRAGLWGKSIWAQYPERMLQNRARGFALRDAFPDLLRGLKTGEELIDTPPDTFRGTTITAAPTKAPASDLRTAINDEIPDRVMHAPSPAPAKRGFDDWLADRAIELAAAPDLPAIDAIVMSPEVERVAVRLKPQELEEWQALMAENVARLHVPTQEEGELVVDDVFPGG